MDDKRLELEQLQLLYTEQKKAIPAGIHNMKEKKSMLMFLIIAFTATLLIFGGWAVYVDTINVEKYTLTLQLIVVIAITVGVGILVIIRIIQSIRTQKYKEKLSIFIATEEALQEVLKDLFEIKINEIKLIENSNASLEVAIRKFNWLDAYMYKLPELYVKQEINDGKREEIKLFDNNAFRVNLYSAELAYYPKGVKTYEQRPEGWYIKFTTKKVTRKGFVTSNAYYELITEEPED